VDHNKVPFRHALRCALLRCANKNTRNVLPAQRSNEHRSVCVNCTLCFYYRATHRAAARRAAARSAATSIAAYV